MTEEVDQRPAIILPQYLYPLVSETTNHDSGWTGLQVFRFRNSASNEARWPLLSQHLLVLMTRPPAKMAFRYEGGNRNTPLLAGSITVMPVATEAEVRWQGPKDSLHIYLEPDLIARVVASLDLNLPSKVIPPLDNLVVPDLRHAMLAVEAELTTGGLGGSLMIEWLANILALRLIRHIYSLKPLVTREAGVLTRQKLKLIIDYIMANLSGRPTLEQMSNLLQVSSFHFARQFKASTGLSPHQFLITRRVERAQQILSQRGNLSLTEIATTVGFSDQSQFSFHFKRIIGVTPGQFRASTKFIQK
jgi:AraC family transcriptional regulator